MRDRRCDDGDPGSSAWAQQQWDVYSQSDFREALSLVGPADAISVQANINLNPEVTLTRSLRLFNNGFIVAGLSTDNLFQYGLARRTLGLIPTNPSFGYSSRVSVSGSLDQLRLAFGTALRATGPLTVEGHVSLGDVCPCGTWIQTIDTDRFVVTFMQDIVGAGDVTLVKVGSGTLVLSGQNVASEVVILDGVLQVGADAALGPRKGAFNSEGAPLTLDGGALRAAASFEVGRAVTMGTGGHRRHERI